MKPRFFKKMANLIIRLIFKVFIALVVFVLIISVYFYYNKDRLIRNFITSLNKNIPRPISVDQINLNVITHFPNVTIVLKNVKVKDSLEDEAYLSFIDRIEFRMNLVHFFHGEYVVNKLCLSNGVVNISDKKLQIIKTSNNIPCNSKNIYPNLNLEHIFLKNIEIRYSQKHTCFDLYIKNATAKLNWLQPKLNICFSGNTELKNVKYEEFVWQKVPISMKATNLLYDNQFKTINIENLVLEHNKIPFVINGAWSIDKKCFVLDKSLISLKIHIPQITIVQAKNFIPIGCLDSLTTIPLDGNLSMDIAIKEKPGVNLGLKCDLVLKNGTYKPEFLLKPIIINNLNGSLDLPNLREYNVSSTKIYANDVSCTLEDSKLEGGFSIDALDFSAPSIKMQGILDISSLNKLIVASPISNANGKVFVQLNLTPNISKGHEIDCTLQLKDLGFGLKTSSKLLCKEFNGEILLTNDCVLKDCVGFIGSDKVVINAVIKEPFLLITKNGAFCTDIKLQSDKLDAIALLAGLGLFIDDNGKESTKSTPNKYDVCVNCNIKELKFLNYTIKNMHGKFLVKDQKMETQNLQFDIAKGKVTMDAQIENVQHKTRINAKSQLKGLNISELFTVFNNFGQTFIVDKNLKGILHSNIDCKLDLDKNNNTIWESLCADVDFKIHKGELNNLESAKKIEPYVTGINLEHLQLEEIENNIHIENGRINIPTMKVKSNSVEIEVSGTHDFNGHIDYNLIVPIENCVKSFLTWLPKDLPMEFLYGIKLSLNISGDSDNYKANIDTKALQAAVMKQIKEKGGAFLQMLFGNYTEPKQTKELDTNKTFKFD